MLRGNCDVGVSVPNTLSMASVMTPEITQQHVGMERVLPQQPLHSVTTTASARKTTPVKSSAGQQLPSRPSSM